MAALYVCCTPELTTEEMLLRVCPDPRQSNRHVCSKERRSSEHNALLSLLVFDFLDQPLESIAIKAAALFKL